MPQQPLEPPGEETRTEETRTEETRTEETRTEETYVEQPSYEETPVAEATESFPALLDAWYLTGATASGKTRVALELAERLGAEIISLDSMAVFIGMNIGTAKPSAADRQRVPHHLLDLLPPSQEFSLVDYLRAAHRVAAEIRERGRVPLFVGGTPLYLKSLLRGLSGGPAADWNFRGQIQEELQRVGEERGLALLHDRLRQVDPLAAAKLHPRDKRRVIRALEVNYLTGQPLSHQQVQFDEVPNPSAGRVFVLTWPRELLLRRIDERVDQMFAEGLIDEVRGLVTQHGSLSRTALQAVGYREVLEFLQGKLRQTEMIARVKVRTHQFSKRQETWFRGLAECRRVVLGEPFDAVQAAEQILTESQ